MTAMVTKAWLLLLASLPGIMEETPRLSPEFWADGVLERTLTQDQEAWQTVTLAEGRQAMIATTSFPGTSVEAGLQALRQGGSAVDAALVTALTQISRNMGSWSSFAGVFNMVVYHAETGEVHNLNAGWHIPREEREPLSIPRPGETLAGGRGILVPGFMAGVQAAHDRFGKLPFPVLFEPAIYFAEKGFAVTPMHAWLINFRKNELARLPETKAVFTKEDGRFYQQGDLFRQPALARTLRRVAQEGSAYLYQGDWAKKLVTAVRREGGKLTLADLKNYRALWLKPLRGHYRDYEMAAPGFPTYAGLEAVEAFNLLDQARLPRDRKYFEDAEVLYRFIQLVRVGPLLTLAPIRNGYRSESVFSGLDLSDASRLRRQTAAALWQRVLLPDWNQTIREALTQATPPGTHSDSVVVVDPRGNVVALTHSINVAVWGELGLMIDGISLGDAAKTQQHFIDKAGPGNRLPDFTNPLLILRKGRPVVASGAVGTGLHEVTIQNLINLLDYGFDPKTAVETPKFLTPFYSPMAAKNPEYHKQRFHEGSFPEELLQALEKLGQEVHIQKKEDLAGFGYWVGLLLDPEKGLLQGSTTAGGGARGY